MQHNKAGRKLGRTSAHRKALFRNQLDSLFTHERIQTTLPKAKELRPLAEKLVTLGKRGGLHARRLALRDVSQDAVKRLFDEIAPRFATRPGGYTRIMKLGTRPGDGAEKAILEFVGTLGPGHLFLPQAELDVGLHAHVGKEGIGLKHHVHRTAVGRNVGDIRPVDPDAPAGGAVQPGEEAQQGGLAAPRAAQKGEKLPLVDIQADAIEGQDLAKAAAYPLDAHIRLGPGVLPSLHGTGFPIFEPGHRLSASWPESAIGLEPGPGTVEFTYLLIASFLHGNQAGAGFGRGINAGV